MFKLFARIATLLTFATIASVALSQTYPSKPVTLIVPFSPGASADGIARIVGRELSQALGQPVVVENKPGAGGALGLMTVAKASADGYTIGLGATGAIVINPNLPDAPPLNPQRDLMPLAKLADIPLVVVSSAAGEFGNLKAMIATAKKKPGGLSYGNSGQYTSQHLAGELLASMTGAPLLGIPYRGSGPAITDLLGSNLPVAVVDLTSAYPHIKAGKLVALGVTSRARSKVAPEIPTIAEEGVAGYEAPAWMGLFLPAKTPADIRAKLTNAIKALMASPAVQTQISGLSAEPAFMDGKAFEPFIAGESKKWEAVISKMPPPAK